MLVAIVAFNMHICTCRITIYMQFLKLILPTLVCKEISVGTRVRTIPPTPPIAILPIY